MILVIEVCYHEVRQAIRVEIGDICAHARTGDTLRVICDFPVDSGVAKGPVSLIDEQQIRRGIAGHKEVRPAISVGIYRYYAERSPRTGRHSGSPAHVRKTSIPMVVKQA